MQDTASVQNTNRTSTIDLVIFGIAAVLPIFFIAMLWFDSHPAVSYLVDRPAPDDFRFNPALMWLLPISITGIVTFALWGLLDVYATKFTSRFVAIFAGIGLIYYLWVFSSLGLGAIGQFTSFTIIPVNGLDTLTTIKGGSAFVPLLILLIVLVIQLAVPRGIGERPTGEETPRAFGLLPLPILAAGTAIGTFLLFVLLANWGLILKIGGDILTFIFNRERAVDPILCSESATCVVVQPIIFTLIVLIVVVTGFAYTTLLERKLIAFLQQRDGPNRVGPGGFLQPAADGVKLIFKEDIVPAQADLPVWRLAPILKAVPTLVVLAVIPLAPDWVIPWFDGNWYQIPMGLADIGVGVLFLVAVTSIGTYGVVLAGWASNNKYSMLGGMRAASQMISYELSMGLTLAVPVLLAGSMSVTTIVQDQSGLIFNWYVFQNPLAALILIIALIAEVNRAPFDLPEAEQELTAGYMTEYSGMKFALFMMAEYLGMIGVSMIAIAMFFGGYNDGFGLVNHIPLLGPVVVVGKVILCLMGLVWIRGTLPRLRYDRLMSFGWKIMLPLALLSVVWTAVAVIIGEEFGSTAYLIVSNGLAVAVLVGAYFFMGWPETNDDDDDAVITGERDGWIWGGVMFLGGIVAIPIALYKATAPILGLLTNVVVTPVLALFNVGESRERFRNGLLVAVEPIANLGAPEAIESAEEPIAEQLETGDNEEESPQLESAD
jgi:NADH-quinone oxidoreductase subunit H